MILLIPLMFFLQIVFTLYTVQPTWITSDLVRAGNENIVTTRTGALNIVPTYTFIFSRNLSATPYLGYGVKRYEGNYL